MALSLNLFYTPIPIILFSLLLLLSVVSSALDDNKAKIYIVHVKTKNPSSTGGAETEDTIKNYHMSFLPQGAKDSLIYSPPLVQWLRHVTLACQLEGRCDLPEKFGCNNKVIGARAFKGGSASALPVDRYGHRTHTASIAVGAFVPNVSVQGNAGGTASGIAPRSHLAAYKVCFAGDCQASDTLAGIDAAIEDGVDLLSISLAGVFKPFYESVIAISSFAAAKKGILTSVAAGNDGPSTSTVINDAPWLLTVGASTIDRRIRATAKMGNGLAFDGESVFQPENFSSHNFLQLVYFNMCYNGSLVGFDVRNKIVLCDGDDITSSAYEKATYNVTFSRDKNVTGWGNNESVAQGFLLWKSGKHTVRSVIAINITEKAF
ncbi:Subtilisin-like protease SBT1.7 [Striga hermonthica]|uniref:Subtilisin-like protease SBT1.7 n=1 Tax=Striga hermonthica TaxID=68872 RepID=A0A9N7R8Y4_STRHE|nr:Subtilisin-like protease SBT1.7 [Striga hermonthica]